MGVGDSRLEGDRLRCPLGHLNLSPPPSSGSRIAFGVRDDNGSKAPIIDFPMLHCHMSLLRSDLAAPSALPGRVRRHLGAPRAFRRPTP